MSVSLRLKALARTARLVAFVALGLVLTASTATQSAERTGLAPSARAKMSRATNPPPLVTISPTGRLVTTGSVTVDVKFCQQWGGSFFQSQSVELDNVDVSSSFSVAQTGQDVDCDYFEIWQGTLSLSAAPEVQTFRAVVLDWNSYQGEDEVEYAVPSKWSNVLVSSEAGFVTVVPSSSGNTQTLAIWNLGEVNATYSLSASCSGAATPSTCSLSTGSVSVNAGSSNTATVTYTASATPGDTAVIKLIALDNVSPFRADTGWSDVTVGSASSAGVAIARSHSTVRRGACVTVGFSGDAAMECGSLRLAHALPAVATLGSAKVPTLIYNSDLARPIPIVHADVNIGCGSLPSSVDARVYVGGTQRGYRSFTGSNWSACSKTRRIGIDVDVSAYGTSLQDYYVHLTYNGSVRRSWRG